MTRSLADYLKETWPVRVGNECFIDTKDGRVKIEGPSDFLLVSQYALAWFGMFTGLTVYQKTREG